MEVDVWNYSTERKGSYRYSRDVSATGEAECFGGLKVDDQLVWFTPPR